MPVAHVIQVHAVVALKNSIKIACELYVYLLYVGAYAYARPLIHFLQTLQLPSPLLVNYSATALRF